MDLEQEVQFPTAKISIKPTTATSLKKIDRLDEIYQEFDSETDDGKIQYFVTDSVKQTKILSPDVRETLFTHAMSLIDSMEVRSAADLLTHILSYDSEDREALKWLAWCFREDMRPGDAAEIYQNLSDLEPTEEIFYELGKTYYQVKNYRLAAENFFKSLERAGSESALLFETFKHLGNSFLQLGDVESAEENYFKALNIMPNSDTVRVNLGSLYFQKVDFETSLENFKQALTINPFNDLAWAGLALVNHEKGDSEWADAAIQKCLDLNPRNLMALQLLISRAQATLSFDSAISRATHYIKLNPEDEQMRYVLAGLLFQVGEKQECLRNLDVLENAGKLPNHVIELKSLVSAKYGS